MTSATEAPLQPRSMPAILTMAAAIGVIAGIGAWGFRMLIGFVHNTLFLGSLSADYDANVHTVASPWGLGVILVPVIGALVVAWLVKNFAPEAKGHGVPEVMDAIYYNKGYIRPRVAIVKSLASAISIGSGGSVGREGPIVQIGSAFGSTLGTIFPMLVRDRVALIAAGAGAGIAATFNAPLGGILFAMELLLVSVNARNFLVVAIAVVVATHISHLLLGTQPSFYVPQLEIPFYPMFSPVLLFSFLLLGCVMGLVSVAFIRGLYKLEDIFDAMPGNYYSRHALGMLCVGIIMYLLMKQVGHYYVEGVGYATIMDILSGAVMSPWFLLMLAALKLLATCLSLGSGASGGVFSPALFMGATVGAAAGYLCQWLMPEADIAVTTFAIAGMAAAIAGTTGAVLTGIIMLAEMTRDYPSMLPMIITCTAAYGLRKAIMDESIYTMKLLARHHTVPEGLHAAILTTERIVDLMDTNFEVRLPGSDITTAAAVVVQDSKGQIVSVSTSSRENAGNPSVADLKFIVVPAKTTPLAALASLCETGADVILVTKEADSGLAADIVGLLTPAILADLLRADDTLS
ncbi:chloride channel protein [Candidatus Marimicrobium litorale]|uniref:Chloride channel protein n=1 Tax=Candidatus Marimicrobium litorale TaxID=2518991 RepID=A0ABT3T8T1_9GAMM|nr:chloride channel protein [Candidatus Marimicrobium litorale]MCX2978686.1 chloride channel protein [Candidatus Marimicrobium litorale]